MKLFLKDLEEFPALESSHLLKNKKKADPHNGAIWRVYLSISRFTNFLLGLNTLDLKSFKPNLNDLEDGREIERTSDFNSLTQDAFAPASIDEGLDHCTEEDTRTLKPSRIMEKDFPETPIRVLFYLISYEILTSK